MINHLGASQETVWLFYFYFFSDIVKIGGLMSCHPDFHSWVRATWKGAKPTDYICRICGARKPKPVVKNKKK